MKATAKELRKKHHQVSHSVTLNYYEGDSIDKILTKLKNKLGGASSAMVRNAILYYSLFVEKAEGDLNQNETNKNTNRN